MDRFRVPVCILIALAMVAALFGSTSAGLAEDGPSPPPAEAESGTA